MVEDKEKKKRKTEGQAYLREREKLASQRGISSKAAAQALSAGEPETTASAIERQMEANKLKEQIIQQEVLKQGETETIPSVNQLRAENQLENQLPSLGQGNIAQRVGAGIGVLKDALPPGLIINEIIGKKTEGGALAKRTVAEVYDFFHSALTRKKPLKYENAKDGFEASIKIIEKNIDDVRNGASYVEAKSDFERAAIALNRLERSSSGFAQQNLNWWTDDGISIQTEILNQQAILAELRRDLEIAKQEARVNKARMAIGI